MTPKIHFPFLGILTLIFITLKLTGHILWSWWWVLAPLWIPAVILVTILLILGIYYVFIDKNIKKSKRY